MVESTWMELFSLEEMFQTYRSVNQSIHRSVSWLMEKNISKVWLYMVKIRIFHLELMLYSIPTNLKKLKSLMF